MSCWVAASFLEITGLFDVLRFTYDDLFEDK
jgi:hypothetical protein